MFHSQEISLKNILRENFKTLSSLIKCSQCSTCMQIKTRKYHVSNLALHWYLTVHKDCRQLMLSKKSIASHDNQQNIRTPPQQNVLMGKIGSRLLTWEQFLILPVSRKNKRSSLLFSGKGTLLNFFYFIP